MRSCLAHAAQGSLDRYQKTAHLPLANKGSGKGANLNFTWFPHSPAVPDRVSPTRAGTAGHCQHPLQLVPTTALAASPCGMPDTLQPHTAPLQSNNSF